MVHPNCGLIPLDRALQDLHSRHPAGVYLGGIAQMDVRHTLARHGWVMPKRLIIRSPDVAFVVRCALALHDTNPPTPGAPPT